MDCDIGMSFIFKSSSIEELICSQDRWQIHNLADDRKYADALKRHRLVLKEWMRKTNDHGTESDDIYVLETEDQMKGNKNEVSRRKYRENVDVYRRWAKEGI